MKTLRISAILLWVLAPASVMAAGASGPSVDPDQLALNVAPSDTAALKADAHVNALFPQAPTSLSLSIEADPSLARPDPLVQNGAAAVSRESIGLSTAWIAAPGTRLDLSVADRLGQTWRPTDWAVASGHQIDTDDRGATIALSLTPIDPLDVTVSGAASRTTVQDTAALDTSTPTPRSLLATTTQSAKAGLRWRPLDWFSLDASGRIASTDAAWRGAAAGGAWTGSNLSYASFEPAVTGALTTPGQGKLGLTFEHAVSPLDPGAFSTFAAVEDRAADARLGPNREWRYRLNFDQTLLGGVKVSAAVIQAHIESATELGPVGQDLQAPVSVGGGQRQEIDLALSTPLAAVGLPSISLQGSGSWRNSQVRDPFTGDLRRASAESPQTASIGVIQSLAGGLARWGLQGQFGGDQTLYQMSQLSTISVADSLGGFVEYHPGAFALRLRVDGLYGGQRTSTDLYYLGDRSTGVIDHSDRRTDSGQAVRLILSKAL